jgi:hypothetical protein
MEEGGEREQQTLQTRHIQYATTQETKPNKETKKKKHSKHHHGPFQHIQYRTSQYLTQRRYQPLLILSTKQSCQSGKSTHTRTAQHSTTLLMLLRVMCGVF